MTQSGGDDRADDQGLGELAPAVESGERAIEAHDGDLGAAGSLTGHFRSEQLRLSRGVLTDPQSLREYEAAFPGAAQMILERFFRHTDAEQQHRHAMERAAAATEAAQTDKILRQADRGQWMAFGIAAIGLGIVAYLATLQEPYLAALVGVLDLGGLVGVFIYGKKQQAANAEPEEDEDEADEDEQPQ